MGETGGGCKVTLACVLSQAPTPTCRRKYHQNHQRHHRQEPTNPQAGRPELHRNPVGAGPDGHRAHDEICPDNGHRSAINSGAPSLLVLLHEHRQRRSLNLTGRLQAVVGIGVEGAGTWW